MYLKRIMTSIIQKIYMLQSFNYLKNKNKSVKILSTQTILYINLKLCSKIRSKLYIKQ